MRCCYPLAGAFVEIACNPFEGFWSLGASLAFAGLDGKLLVLFRLWRGNIELRRLLLA